MFETHKPIYMTKAVAEEMSEEHLYYIIQYLIEKIEQLTDYLQVFEFYIENGGQWLIQRQEVPERETTQFVDLKETKPIYRKVWVLDQHDHVMILFPEDY